MKIDETLAPGQWAFDCLPTGFVERFPQTARVTVVAGDLATAKGNFVMIMRKHGFEIDYYFEPVAYRPTTKRKQRGAEL